MDRLAGRLIERFRDEPDDPSIVGLDDAEADRIFEALGSKTSRAILSSCYEEPRTRSELATELDTTIQNIGYHVEKLEQADLLEPVETRYGENRKEVRVYGPSKRAVLIAAGEPGLVERLLVAVKRLFAPLLFAGLVTAAVSIVARGPEPIGLLGDAPTGSSVGGPWLALGIVVFALCLVSLLTVRRRRLDSRTRGERSGQTALLYGRDARFARRSTLAGVALLLVSFVSLDAVLVSSSEILTNGASIALALALPVAFVASIAHAFRNDGVLVAWFVTSAPLVGGWCYIATGAALEGRFGSSMVATGFVLAFILGAPLGSIAYLVGHWWNRRRGGTDALARSVSALLVAYVALVALAITGWLFAVIYQ